MVMAKAVMIADAGGRNPHSFRIGGIQPGRAGAAGSGQNGINAIFIQPVHDFGQPFEVVLPFPGLIGGPGKYAEGGGINARFFHHADVFF